MRSRLFGVLLFIETAALLLTALVAWHYREGDHQAFLITAGITGGAGLIVYLIGRLSKKKLVLQDTFLVVALSWVLFSLFGMLPFILSGSVNNITDAFFETMSGFSTTGTTILRNVESQTKGILFWRSITQWMGGLGIVVFTLAFIPTIAKSSRSKGVSLFAAEAPGLNVEKLTPSMRGTSRLLWGIYINLTIICAFLYWLGPMDLFDAVCHAFTTIATGGFSTHQESIGYFHSEYLEYVCAVFMTLSAVNFALYHFMVVGRWDIVRRNEEVKVYLSSIVVLTLVFFVMFYVTPSFDGVTESQLESYPQDGEATLRTSFFHVASMLSNTGFTGQNGNYDLWGMLFVIPTLLMVIVGGCAGSTSGGLKMVRVIVLFKFVRNSVKELIHPTGMFSVKLSGQPIDEITVRRVCSFFAFFLFLLVVNAIVLPLTGLSLEDSCIAFLSCFSNLGLGSGATGPGASAADLPAAAKWILSFDMLVGRLEIMTVFLLFSRSFWTAESR